MSRPDPTDARHFRLVHRTTYTYPEPVTSSYGRALLLPRTTGGQVCHSSEIRTTPSAAEIAEHRDFYGNRSSYFAITEPHTVLEVVAESVLTVARRTPHVDRIPAMGWSRPPGSPAPCAAPGTRASPTMPPPSSR